MTTAENISAVTHLLMVYRQKSTTDLAAHLRMSVKSLGRRLRGELGWQADEVAAMADLFDVSVLAFYQGPDALMSGAGTTRQYLSDTADPTLGSEVLADAA